MQIGKKGARKKLSVLLTRSLRKGKKKWAAGEKRLDNHRTENNHRERPGCIRCKLTNWGKLFLGKWGKVQIDGKKMATMRDSERSVVRGEDLKNAPLNGMV